MTLYRLNSRTPQVDPSAWVAPDANVIGNVILERKTSVWFGTTLRGDNELIKIGAGSNIQENVVIHTDIGYPVQVGENCTIGHKVILHGCEIADTSLIGMGAIVLNGAKIGKNCLIGAGALITENKVIPDGSLVVGSPGRVVRALSAKEIQGLAASALHYQENAAQFRDQFEEQVIS